MAFDERNFWLHTRNNPHSRVRENGVRFWGYLNRVGGLDAVTCIVLHTTQNAPKTPALNVANWQAFRAPAPSSYHSLVDHVEVVNTLPERSVAFHAVNFNTRGLGLSFTTMADAWGRDKAFDQALLVRGAQKAREWCRQFDIPTRMLTRDQASRGIKGFIRHSTADPSRRGDPGPNFPVKAFFSLINNVKDETEDDMTPADRKMLREVHEMLEEVQAGKIGGRRNVGTDLQALRFDNRAFGRHHGLPIILEGDKGERGHGIIS